MSLDLIGKRYFRLLVIEKTSERRFGNVVWVCRCDCGKITKALTNQLNSRTKKSCGCLVVDAGREIGKRGTHHLTKAPIYAAWCRMKNRCYRENDASYHNYGGRGIKVCERWMVFSNFNEDMGSSWRSGMTLDRINPNDNYSLENCRWATTKQQANNKRNTFFIEYRGKKKSMTEWANILKIPKSTLFNRLRNQGWGIRKSLETPTRS